VALIVGLYRGPLPRAATEGPYRGPLPRAPTEGLTIHLCKSRAFCPRFIDDPPLGDDIESVARRMRVEVTTSLGPGVPAQSTMRVLRWLRHAEGEKKEKERKRETRAWHYLTSKRIFDPSPVTKLPLASAIQMEICFSYFGWRHLFDKQREQEHSREKPHVSFRFQQVFVNRRGQESQSSTRTSSSLERGCCYARIARVDAMLMPCVLLLPERERERERASFN
jgi:hypothetical protein